MPTLEEMRAWLAGGMKGKPGQRIVRPNEGDFAGQGIQDLGDGPYPGQNADRPCLSCKRARPDTEVTWRSSRTAYDWDGKGDNPNACLALCDECAEGYNEQMDSQWADYYSGLM